MHTGKLEIVEITDITEECADVFTVKYRDRAKASPGQFVMVWAPGVNEVPMSLSFIGDEKGFTFRVLGKTTTALSRLGKSDRIGIRGVFGNAFKPVGTRILFIGGGTGVASIISAADLFSPGRRAVAAIGAKNRDGIFFADRMRQAGADVLISTDDGSLGEKGFVTAVARRVLEREDFDTIIACGPELMLSRVAELALEFRTPAQISTERFMKCGIGICDACSLNGVLVCRDGPVFDGEFLLGCDDFGRYRLSPCGARVPI